mmetsp:Transcript_20005/g.45423  ORF Transcript_20005/g.45423 Transcript_20005/m.45423 type:complete len:92 (+) Transcript_20005:203-478(+)
MQDQPPVQYQLHIPDTTPLASHKCPTCFPVAYILEMITSSSMETKLVAEFYNAKDDFPFRVALEEMDHSQPPTPIEVDNQTALGFLQDTMK